MKKVLIACLLILPLVANANTLQVNAASNKLNVYNSAKLDGTIAQVDYKNLGRLGSFSIINKDGVFSVAYLAEETSNSNKYKSDGNQDGRVTEIKHTTNAVSMPAALPLLATAIGLFCFGANRRRV